MNRANVLKKLEDLLAILPKEILDLEVVEIAGSNPDSIHLTKMSTALSSGILAALGFHPERNSEYFQIGVFNDFESALAFANDFEQYLRHGTRIQKDPEGPGAA